MSCACVLSTNVIIAGVTWHPGGKYLLSASDDKTLRVWDIAHRRCHKRLDAHNHFTTSIGQCRTANIEGIEGCVTNMLFRFSPITAVCGDRFRGPNSQGLGVSIMRAESEQKMF